MQLMFFICSKERMTAYAYACIRRKTAGIFTYDKNNNIVKPLDWRYSTKNHYSTLDFEQPYRKGIIK